MKFRALDALGDWEFGAGQQSYLSDEAAIAADVGTALKIFLGEVSWAMDAGVDWWNLIGARSDAGIILQCRQVISARENVTRINSVASVLNRNTRGLTVTYSIDTVFTRNLNGEVSIPVPS